MIVMTSLEITLTLALIAIGIILIINQYLVSRYRIRIKIGEGEYLLYDSMENPELDKMVKAYNKCIEEKIKELKNN